ncbi:tRNA (adenine22-N1)-methyltransferase [Streptococcus gallinaceus]|uniref:tRNA (adenine(22)-N(1))-methyltransferase n=1 Tax=Streptococcus gallinaceus TaxID=165758 RepID=UPI00209CEB31|nr:tRNA (adenine(22)-N(1))-methyltransferase TrmK [Streptococcus gallinaceus]MCP1638673.1 tRNA (adenine22-N1)-methyltransferase [Streptococcus gallinaceus]MCP1769240.1 tRNA (adenine22-N1)-methyltransferase [Streptococcus gallinaceus]
MEKTRLSKRLETVAGFVPEGARLVDVGSDHAYLPLFLVEAGKIDYAVAGEVVRGPFESALSNVQEAGQASNIQVRLANGLAAVEDQDQITAVTIAGMGGRLVAAILEDGQDKLKGVERLILQPNNREDDVRMWLQEHDYQLVAEAILEENEKIYEILVAEPGEMTLSAKELRFGLYLQQEGTTIFQKKWQSERSKLSWALDQVPETHRSDRSAISQKIKDIDEVLHESK